MEVSLPIIIVESREIFFFLMTYQMVNIEVSLSRTSSGNLGRSQSNKGSVSTLTTAKYYLKIMITSPTSNHHSHYCKITIWISWLPVQQGISLHSHYCKITIYRSWLPVQQGISLHSHYCKITIRRSWLPVQQGISLHSHYCKITIWRSWLPVQPGISLHSHYCKITIWRSWVLVQQVL
jgi:hypothetical protein